MAGSPSGRVSVESAELPLTRTSGHVEFRLDALPLMTELEREWRQLQCIGNSSFFTSWHWIGTLLTALPPARRPRLLRGRANGTTIALALLGARETRRRRGLVRSRGLYL